MTTMLIRELKTVSEVVDALGGTAKVARLTKRAMQAVSNWRSAGRFPPDTFLIVRQELVANGYEAAPSLWGITAAQEGVATA